MPKLINKKTGNVVSEGPYGGKAEDEWTKSANQQKASNPDLEIEHRRSYQGGGLLNRSPVTYKSSVSYARGGGAARKDGTRFYVVTAEK